VGRRRRQLSVGHDDTHVCTLAVILPGGVDCDALVGQCDPGFGAVGAIEAGAVETGADAAPLLVRRRGVGAAFSIAALSSGGSMSSISGLVGVVSPGRRTFLQRSPRGIPILSARSSIRLLEARKDCGEP